MIRLVQAHIDLAKTEFSEILGEVKRLAIGAGVAFGLLLFIGLLVPVGTTLFFGEWLFGSMGWGVLHGTELAIAIAVAAMLGALRLPGRSIGGAFAIALISGIVVGLVFGFDLPHEAWRALGETVAPGLGPDNRPLVVGALVMALVVAVLGAGLAMIRGWGGGAAVGCFVLGAVIGLLVGAFTAIAFTPQVGAALGVTVGLLTWSIGMAVAVARRGIDLEALKTRLWPQQTIDTTKETIEWVLEQTQRGPKS